MASRYGRSAAWSRSFRNTICCAQNKPGVR